MLRLGNASKIVCNLFYGYDVYHVLCIFSNYRMSDQFFIVFFRALKMREAYLLVPWLFVYMLGIIRW